MTCWNARTQPDLVEETSRQRKTVLIVDDEQWILHVLRDLLEDAGYDVRIALHGRAALILARQNALSFILTDLMMPEMDGQTLCDQLRRDPQTMHLPIVLMTAVRRPRLPARFTAMIGKPFDIDDVLRLVEKHAI